MNCDVLFYPDVLIHQNRERIEFAAATAIQHQYAEPVVLLLDLNDDVARAIVSYSGREAEMHVSAREYQQRGLTPVVVWPLPGRVAAGVLETDLPGFAEGLGTLPSAKSFHLIVVACGVTGLVQLELP
jgi:hypothetical protein